MARQKFNTYPRQKERGLKRKLELVEYKGGKCEKCGLQLTDTNCSVFDFHHIDPKQKEFAWTKMRLLSDKKIKEELIKCQLLCANCHRLTHSIE